MQTLEENATRWIGKDGTEFNIRPIRPHDEPLLVEFHKGLSQRSVFQRYFSPLPLAQRVAHDRLVSICAADFVQQMILIAEQIEASGVNRILGVGGLVKTPGTAEAELAILVADEYQGLGLGTELLRRLLDIGRSTELTRITGYILPENRTMQYIARKLGFQVQYRPEQQVVTAELEHLN
jgi:acetyltransferase